MHNPFASNPHQGDASSPRQVRPLLPQLLTLVQATGEEATGSLAMLRDTGVAVVALEDVADQHTSKAE